MKIVSVICSLLAGVALALPICINCWTSYGLWSLAFYAAILFALSAASLLHELGHMLFGAMSRVKAVPELSFFASSSCKIIPKTHKNLRARMIVTSLGGLIVNLIFVVLGIVVAAVPDLPVWLGVLSPASAYLFVLNAFPVEYSGGKSDGRVVVDLLQKNNPESKVMLAVLGVQAMLLNGTDIKDIDKSLIFDLPQIREDDPSFVCLCELRYKYLEALGNKEEAEKYKRRFEDLKEEYF